MTSPEQFDRTVYVYVSAGVIMSACQISPKQDYHSEVIMLIFQMAAVESQDSGTMMALCANQISMRYLNPRLV